jgi:anti-sigma-K factor RskA
VKHELHTFAGPYALGAISDTERRRFERHLTDCETCAQEVRGLRETAARLGASAAAAPPEELREKVLTEVARTRQLPPYVARSHRDRLRGAGWILSAACLLLAVVFATTSVRSQHRADRAEALNRRIEAVMSAPDARAVTGKARPAGGGVVVASRSLGQAVVVMSGLRTLPAARTYQLWLMGPGPPRSVGTMNPAGGRAPPVIADGLGDADQIGITVEPSGGSPRPTGAPIFAVSIT